MPRGATLVNIYKNPLRSLNFSRLLHSFSVPAHVPARTVTAAEPTLPRLIALSQASPAPSAAATHTSAA
jgi:hypothetical protein